MTKNDLKSRKFWITLAVIAALLVYALFLPEQPYVRSVIITACIFATLCQFYNLCYGIIGISNFGYAGFMAIGSYVSAIAATDFGVPVVLAMLMGTLAAALAGFILMIPCLRMHGFTPGIITLAFAKIVQVILSAMKVTNGEMGYWGITPLFASKRIYFAFAVIMAALSLLFIKVLMNSKTGLAFRIINDDQQAAASVGTDVKKYKLIAMSISCAGAGFVGAFYAHYLLTITPGLASMSYTCEVLCMTMFGGLGTVSGPIIGAVLITCMTELLRFLEDFRTLIYGVLLVVVILFFPKGIVGIAEKLKARIGMNLSTRKGKEDENHE